MRTLAITAALLAGITLSAAQPMTAQQYHAQKGPCVCPDDTDKAGHK